MNKVLAGTILIMLFVSANIFAGTAAQNWEKLEKKVRENAIGFARAKAFVRAMRPQLDAYYYEASCDTGTARFVFPVEGYGKTSIGGKKGSGYIPKGYNFYDADKHGDHPAYDIFIRDRNHDLLDDRTGRPVRILSATAGVVVSINTGWVKDSKTRGGNYVWVYDPELKGLFYYAHMNTVSVTTGDILKAGQALGTVGRTGKNAAAKRSPTHLHFMFLSYGKDGTMKPEKIYDSLTKCIMPVVPDEK